MNTTFAAFFQELHDDPHDAVDLVPNLGLAENRRHEPRIERHGWSRPYDPKHPCGLSITPRNRNALTTNPTGTA